MKARPNVLWCYKKDLDFRTHGSKSIAKIRKKIHAGSGDVDQEDPFELFIASTQIRYCYYKESQKILGNTYGMLVLQDFEAITPNILARTIETVEGGGIVVLLLHSMRSLRQLYTMTMDVHARFRTESHHDVVDRFNERFILSLVDCDHCLVSDDAFNVLPISSHIQQLQPVIRSTQERTAQDAVSPALKELQLSLAETQPAGTLVSLAVTMDQARAVLNFIEVITSHKVGGTRATVTLTAGRGRGKSAALGISMASALAYGYSNIFVTSPSPENLTTLFTFVTKSLEAMKYKEHVDYEVERSPLPEFNKAIVKLVLFRDHRQVIQYIEPTEPHRLAQAELLVVDEAAAIPLPQVRALLGNYVVFLSSTVSGYEGTGRSLSLKLFKELRAKASAVTNVAHVKKSAAAGAGNILGSGSHSGSPTSLTELTLNEPIRYAVGDSVEKWLNRLLCLDVESVPRGPLSCPHPSDCQLYYVNRNTLFSYHQASEDFLQRMVSLYVASHYRNSPNDLQLMSDAPAHQLFVLLGPEALAGSGVPSILCAVQVALEGDISKQSVLNMLRKGERASGDLIPWVISQQFQDTEFAGLSGARIVRIATQPEHQRMGYGTRALELLQRYYSGEIPSLSEDQHEPLAEESSQFADFKVGSSQVLLTEVVSKRKDLPPLLMKLSERKAEQLDWVGTSFGMNSSLLAFWNKAGYTPLYIRQTAQDATGEHSCIMLKLLDGDKREEAASWLTDFAGDFYRRFVSLLGYEFRAFPASLALTLMKPKLGSEGKENISYSDMQLLFSPYDLKRLESYSRNLVDYHVVMDMVPSLAKLFFWNKLTVGLPFVQACILMALGLQFKSVSEVAKELEIESSQVMALFNKSMRRFSACLKDIREGNEVSRNPLLSKSADAGAAVSSRAEDDDDAVSDASDDVPESNLNSEIRKERDVLLQSDSVKKYAVAGSDADWQKALEDGKQPQRISIASDKAKANYVPQAERKRHAEKVSSKDKHKSSSSTKKRKHK